MKPGDFVECPDNTPKPGRVLEITGNAVSVALFSGAHELWSADFVRPISLEAAYKAVEEEIGRVEDRSAARIRDLRSQSRAVFRSALVR